MLATANVDSTSKVPFEQYRMSSTGDGQVLGMDKFWI